MILLTGSSGFIGSHLLRTLRERGEEVIPVDLRAPSLPILTQPGKKILIHCANDRTSHKNNIALLKRLHSMMDAMGIGTVIFMNSYATLLGGRKAQTSFNLGFSPRYLSDYALSKLKQERYIEHHFRAVQRIYLYLPAVLGRNGAWDTFFQQLLHATSIGMPTQPGIFNFISIRNLCEIVAALVSALPSEPVVRLPLSAPESEHTRFSDLPPVLSSLTGKPLVVLPDKNPCKFHPRPRVSAVLHGFYLVSPLRPFTDIVFHWLKRRKALSGSATLTAPGHFTFIGDTRYAALTSVYIPAPALGPYGLTWESLKDSLAYLRDI
jgi:nucleoside-diphosphate-sugar epimerase